MNRLSFLKPAAIAFLMISTNSFSADGVVEINQACALNGCYPGDAPGFPVFIQQPGSYRLTGNLDLSGTPDTTGVQISSPFVTLDLNGFEVAGPKVCTGSGSTLDCGGVDDGAGVLIEADARAVVVRNGTVRNMGTEGIWSFADGTTIENIRAMHNARNGLRGQSNTLVTDCVAIENFDDGFDFGAGSVIRGTTALGNGNDGIEINGSNGVVDGTSSRGNGNRGYNLSHSSKFSRSTSSNNPSTDTCGGGICTSARRYYLTTSTHQGDEPLSACVSGFHMASIWEMSNPGDLSYDTLLGQTQGDTGSGPPTGLLVRGWARNGQQNGGSSCVNWTSNSGDTGPVYQLVQRTDLNNPAQKISPWESELRNCGEFWPVWCVED